MFHSRQELIKWLQRNPPDRVIENALEYGVVENLGFFGPIPSSHQPGWIVRLTSRGGCIRLLVIALAKGLPPTFYIWRIKEVPWESWLGKSGGSSVRDGDNPEQYAVLREEARKDEA